MLQQMGQFLSIKQSDIFVSLIGAFFGFGFALFFEWVVSFIHDMSRKKKLLAAITKELKKLVDGDKDTGNGLETKLQSDDPYFRYEYFVWETAKSSGELMLISGKSYFEQLIKIYSRIFFADLLEQRYFDLHISCFTCNSAEIRNQKNALNNARKQARQEIVEEIKSFVDEIKCR